MFNLGFLSVCEFYSGLPMQVMVMRARRNARTAEKFQCSSIQQLLLPGLYQHTSHNLTLLLGNLNKFLLYKLQVLQLSLKSYYANLGWSSWYQPAIYICSEQLPPLTITTTIHCFHSDHKYDYPYDLSPMCPYTARRLRGHPYMTSALRGEGGVSPKEDVVREVA